MIETNGEHGPARVLVLIPTLNVGGAEMDLARNLPRIDRARFRITVCAFLERGELARTLIDAGIEVIGPLWSRPRGSMARRWMAGWPSALVRPLISFLRPAAAAWSYLSLGRTVAGYIRDNKIGVVHAVLPNSYVVGGIATALARRSTLVMSRVGLNWYREQYPLLAMFERHVLHRSVDVVICNSAAVREDLLTEGIPSAKIRLIPNGIDVATFSDLEIDGKQARDRIGVREDTLVFSSVANFHVYKGHADLLHALHLACDRLPSSWTLLAVGQDIDGNLERMRSMSEQLGLSNHVRFLGQRSDVGLILRAADIHVSASHTEGCPNNVLEAMCASLPVVATAVGGVPEVVADGQTGLLVPAKDPERLAHALLQLAHDPSRRRLMGEAGRSLVKSTFPLERSVDALEDIYARGAGRIELGRK